MAEAGSRVCPNCPVHRHTKARNYPPFLLLVSCYRIHCTYFYESITFLYTFKCEWPPQKGFQLRPGLVYFYGKVYFKVQLMLSLHQRERWIFNKCMQRCTERLHKSQLSSEMWIAQIPRFSHTFDQDSSSGLIGENVKVQRFHTHALYACARTLETIAPCVVAFWILA